MVYVLPVFAQHFLKPFELFPGHTGGDVSLFALALFKHIYGSKQDILVDPVEGRSLHMIRPIERHLEMFLKGLLVEWYELGLVTPPWIVANFMIAQGCINLELMISPSLGPLRVILVRPFHYIRLCRPPMAHDQIPRDHCKRGALFFH